MVNIDTVYQRVLAVANKEQRGYITPQEFNLFANQAQLDIFEQYFYDLNQFRRTPGNDTMHADMVDILEEKISFFEVTATLGGPIGGAANVANLNVLDRFYRLSNVRRNNLILESVSRKDFRHLPNSPLAAPTATRPIYMVDTVNNTIQVAGRTFGNLHIDYIRRPDRVEWAYTVVNGYAQFNGATPPTAHFELHPSEETNLVLKILQLSCIVMKDANLYQIAAQEEVKDIQQEKQ